MKNRLLVIFNILLIPYVAIRFPGELRHYVSNIGTVLKTGQPA